MAGCCRALLEDDTELGGKRWRSVADTTKAKFCVREKIDGSCKKKLADFV